MFHSRSRSPLLDGILSLDPVLAGAIVLLLALGLLLIDSATFALHGRAMVVRQAIWIGIGLLGFAITAAIPVPTLRHYAFALWLFCLVLVLLTYGFGEEAYGARRWLRLGFARFQPSEFLKITTVVLLARLAEVYTRDREGSPLMLLPMAGVAGISFLAIAKQPDLGSAATLLAVAGGLLVVMGLPYWALVSLGVLGVVPLGLPAALSWLDLPVNHESLLVPALVVTLGFVLVAALGVSLGLEIPVGRVLVVYLAIMTAGLVAPRVWTGLNPYQRLRLTGFVAPELDPRGSGYNVIQSMIAVGTGGTWGQGLRKGQQTNLGFLPHKHTDFIFSVLGEELGFVGVCVLLLAMATLFVRLFWIAATARSRFGGLVVTGIVTLLSFQTLVNLAMAMGLAPITGLPLPFVSYGGSALIGGFLLLGVAQAVAWEPDLGRSEGGGKGWAQ